VRHAVELHWPALLAGSACVGLGASNWVVLGLGPVETAVLALAALVGVGALGGSARVLALGTVLAAAGLWWGAVRLDALDESLLTAEIGESGSAQLVVTGPARVTPWAVRVACEVRAFRRRPLRERVLLVLPVGARPRVAPFWRRSYA
jgi:hypothetical protein